MSTQVFDDEFWQDPRQNKSTNPELAQALLARASQGTPMRGFSLKHAELPGIDLVHRGSGDGYDLSGSDFYRANLQGAHLFAVDLHGASLMKADLRGANLHCADLRGANLLGVRLDGARLDNVLWGECLLQEQQAVEARRAGRFEQMLDLLQQAEETYRNLRLSLEHAGLFEQAGMFFHREMTMRRLQMPRWSYRRLISYLVDLFCGYGEKPLRVVLFSLGFILLCAVFYFLLGVRYGEQHIGLSLAHGFVHNLMDLLTCIYYSVVTFTTLGYGDLVPIGFARALAAFEAFTGSFTMALFVVVFVKKMTR
jgi:hypothetical protein